MHTKREQRFTIRLDQHWKTMPQSCAMLPEGQEPDGNTTQLRGIIFQCWSRLTVNICFAISQEKCNRFVCRHPWRSNIEYVLIYLILHWTKKPMQMHSVTWFRPCCPRKTWNMSGHVPREHDAVLTKLGKIVYFCTSREVCWTNEDRLIQIIYNNLIYWTKKTTKLSIVLHAGEEDHTRPGWTTSRRGQDSPWKSQSEWQRTEINGESTSMVWPTLGSLTAKEQNRKCIWVQTCWNNCIFTVCKSKYATYFNVSKISMYFSVCYFSKRKSIL